MVHIKVQADLYLKNEDDENCNCNLLSQRIEKRSFKQIKLLPKSKYIYCPSEFQPNNTLPDFTIQIRCWIIDLMSNEINHHHHDNQNDQLKELKVEKRLNEFIIIHSWVRTNLNRIVPFKTIKLRTFTDLISFNLNLLDKFSADDLIRFRSLELELRLDNDFRENLKINFKNSKNRTKSPEFRLRLNKLEVEIDELLTLHIDHSFNRIVNDIFLILISNGQLLEVEIINSKSKQIKIKEQMIGSLNLIVHTKFNDRLLTSKVTVKVKKKLQKSPAASCHQLFTSFKQIENNTKLKIKLLTTSDSFIHLTSIKKDLDLFEKNLDTILNYDQPDQCAIDRCINHFKFNEQTKMQTQINHQSLTSAVDNLFSNSSSSSTNRKPFYFDIYFFSKYIK